MLAGLRAFAIPMPVKFRGITVREGALIQGPAGWGEFSPFAEYGPQESARWLASAIESATAGWPAPVRDRIPVNATVPAVGPQQAAAIVARSGGRTAEVSSAADTSVGLAAGVALAAALPDLPYACGLGTMPLLAGDVTASPLAPARGELPVRRPAVDLDELARWETDPAPWRERAAAAARFLGAAS